MYEGSGGGGEVGSAFFRLQVHTERVEISLVEVYEGVGKTVISVCQKAQKVKQMHFMAVKIRETFWFCDLFKFKKKYIYCSHKGYKVLQQSCERVKRL